jgi:hypothetical protein
VRDRISASIFSQIALGWLWRCQPEHLEIVVFVQLSFDEGFVPRVLLSGDNDGVVGEEK